MNLNFALFCLSRSRNLQCETISLFNKHECFTRNYNYTPKSTSSSNFNSSKQFSTQPQKDEENEAKAPNNNKLPPLMNFPKLTWPSIGKSIKNFFLTNLIIRPYMDKDFDLAELVSGSKKAVDVVSKKLSLGEMKALEGLVTGDIIPALQSRISLMSLSQREQLATNEEDIYFSFPYQVGIIFNEDQADQKRFVEVTMVHHVLKGLSIMRERGEEIPINIGLLPEYRDKIFVINYRYIKEFTKGVESDWTINLVNHFKPADELDDEE